MQRKKLLLSILLIGLTAIAFSAGTYAWFFDDEVSTGNKFQTGTIDIEIVELDKIVSELDGHNLLKPSQVGLLTKRVTNEGNNPARIWKRIRYDWAEAWTDISADGPVEPESGKVQPEDPTKYIDFDLTVTGAGGIAIRLIPYVVGGPNTSLSSVNGKWLELGVLPPGEQMLVVQSFHLQNTDGDTNWAQDDQLIFDEDFQGRQLTGEGGQDGNDPGGDIFPLP